MIVRWMRRTLSFPYHTNWHQPDESGVTSKCGYPIPEDAQWAEGFSDCPVCSRKRISIEGVEFRSHKRKRELSHEQVSEAVAAFLGRGGAIESLPPEPDAVRSSCEWLRNPYEEMF